MLDQSLFNDPTILDSFIEGCEDVATKKESPNSESGRSGVQFVGTANECFVKA